MNAIELIKEYKNICIDIDLIKQQIKFFDELLIDYSKLDLYETKPLHRINNKPIEYMTYSTVEREAFRGDNIRKVKANDIKKEKKLLENKLSIKNNEKNYIDKLLMVLSRNEFYIVSITLIDRYDWDNAMNNYNNKYKNKPLSVSRLKEIRKESLKKIETRINENETNLIKKWSTIIK
jgi:hypothetical protein